MLLAPSSPTLYKVNRSPRRSLPLPLRPVVACTLFWNCLLARSRVWTACACMRPGRATKGRSLKSLWHETVESQTATTIRGLENTCIGATTSSPQCRPPSQLSRTTVAISDREPWTTGPLVMLSGAICSAIVQIPLLCRLQSWSQAEAGFHRRLYLVLTPICITLARFL